MPEMPEEIQATPCECPGKVTKDFTGTATGTGDEDDWQMAAESSARNAAENLFTTARDMAKQKGQRWYNTIECADGCEGKGCDKRQAIKIVSVSYSEPKIVNKRVVHYARSIEKTFFTYSCDVTVTLALTVYCVCRK